MKEKATFMDDNEEFLFDFKHTEFSLKNIGYEVIFKALLYNPGIINSDQSARGDFVDFFLKKNPINVTLFDLILRKSHMDPAKDVYVTEDKENPIFLKYNKIRYFNDKPKLIILKSKTESEIEALIRHCRNIIAHGRFTLTEDNLFIGIDKNGSKISCVIKLKLDDFHEMVNFISKIPYNGYEFEKFVERLFQDLEYSISLTSGSNQNLDIVLLKNGYQFNVDFKVYFKNSRFLTKENLTFLINLRKVSEENKQVDVFIVLSATEHTKEVSKYARENNIIIVDAKSFSSLMLGEDILSEYHMKLQGEI